MVGLLIDSAAFALQDRNLIIQKSIGQLIH